MSLAQKLVLGLLLLPFRAVLYLLLLPLRSVERSLTYTSARKGINRVYRRGVAAADGVIRVNDKRFSHPAVY
jgi:hypothetical protein